jgi:TIR domain
VRGSSDDADWDGPGERSHGRIFISYRREDTAYAAAWLYERLAERLGEEQVFKDVDSIDLGDDFAAVITEAVASCDVLLALIGDEWLSVRNDQGRRRLDDPDDFVRLEVEAALARDVRVIPILVDGAPLPAPEELPPGVRPLVRRQALELSPSRFDFDTARLLGVLERSLAERRGDGVAQAISPAPVARAPGRVRRVALVAGALTAAGAAVAVGVVLAGSDGDSGTTTNLRSAATSAPGVTQPSPGPGLSAAIARSIPRADEPCGTKDADTWMKSSLGAVEQVRCAPRGHETSRLHGLSLEFGRFAGTSRARAAFKTFSSGPGADYTPCSSATRARMRSVRPTAATACFVRADDGIQIVWNDDGSAVMGSQQYDPPTTERAAVGAWSKAFVDRA